MPLGTVIEVNMITPNPSKDLWYDSGAAIHVCNDKSQFKDYEILKGHEVIIANGVRAKVHGKDCVNIQFTFGKKLVLTNIFHIPNIIKIMSLVIFLTKKD